jgi:Spy/CpxP family protein refolding chaperone
MRRLFSFVLGGVLLLGAATLGLQSGAANAAEHDKAHRHHKHHHKHHHHRHYQRNKLSY